MFNQFVNKIENVR